MKDWQQPLAAENKETYLVGDMNIDLLKCSNHLKTGEYPESVFSHGFLPLITNLTHLTDHSATLIDHIYANKQDIYIRYYYKRYFGSFCCVRDHKTENIRTN